MGGHFGISPFHKFPNLAALLAEVREHRNSDRVFAAMVDSVVAGLDAQLQRST